MADIDPEFGEPDAARRPCIDTPDDRPERVAARADAATCITRSHPAYRLLTTDPATFRALLCHLRKWIA